MPGPMRVTAPLLDVLEVLLQNLGNQDGLHGWAIMKAVKRSGPTVYGVLDRLEDFGWITGHWEEQHPEGGKPRRRFYQLTPTGIIEARNLLAVRRTEAARRGDALRPSPGFAFSTWVGSLRGGMW